MDHFSLSYAHLSRKLLKWSNSEKIEIYLTRPNSLNLQVTVVRFIGNIVWLWKNNCRKFHVKRSLCWKVFFLQSLKKINWEIGVWSFLLTVYNRNRSYQWEYGIFDQVWICKHWFEFHVAQKKGHRLWMSNLPLYSKSSTFQNFQNLQSLFDHERQP